MPPKRQNIGRNTRRNQQNRVARNNVTDEDRRQHNESERLRVAQLRANETADQHSSRLENVRSRMEELRANRPDNNQIRRETRRQQDRSSFNRIAFEYNADFEYSSHPKVVIGSMNKMCMHCNALKFQNEPPGMCCGNGKVKLPELQPPPEPLSTLVAGITPESKHFLLNIWKYNACFQMTSFGATNVINDNFMPTFKVQGQIYHRTGSLFPMPDSDHKFLQIYFMGNMNEQIDQRCSYNTGTRREIVASLQTLFHQRNELIRLFTTAIERMPTDDYKVVIKADKTPVGQHERRYNAPTIDEVAIVIVGDEFESRDIVLHRRNNNIQRVAETHRSYDALQYPILFWQGEDGYHFNIKLINPTTGEYLFRKNIFRISNNSLSQSQ